MQDEECPMNGEWFFNGVKRNGNYIFNQAKQLSGYAADITEDEFTR